VATIRANTTEVLVIVQLGVPPLDVKLYSVDATASLLFDF